MEVARLSIRCTKHPMGKLFTRRALAILAVLAFLTVSTVALTHSHSDASSVSESHCALCMAVHNATHVVATSIVTLYFSPVQAAFLFPSNTFTISFVQPPLNQDRAPPQL